MEQYRILFLCEFRNNSYFICKTLNNQNNITCNNMEQFRIFLCEFRNKLFYMQTFKHLSVRNCFIKTTINEYEDNVRPRL